MYFSSNIIICNEDIEKINRHMVKNVNIMINNISAEQIGETLEFEGKITFVNNPTPLIVKGLYKCLDCMGRYEITNDKLDNKIKSKICLDCGSDNIKFIPNESKYIDSQEIFLEDVEDFVDKYGRKRSPKFIKCVVYGKDVNQHVKADIVTVKGVLSLTSGNDMFLEVCDICLSENC